ncbi:hypothetical protein C8R47DRAFT_712998 [Mycena vitilis]|nr:hypothetical protein C8R47DRAFT_712998 [Mycena vitilis]
MFSAMTQTVPLSALATSAGHSDAELTMKYLFPKDDVRLHRFAEYLWGLEIYTFDPTHERSIIKVRKSMESCVGTSWTLVPTEETLEAMASFQHGNCNVPVAKRKSALTEFAAAEYEYIFVPLCTDTDFFVLEPGQAPQRFTAPYAGFPRVASSVNPFFVAFYSREKIKQSHMPDSEKLYSFFSVLKFPWFASCLPDEFLLSSYPDTLITLTDAESEPDLRHDGPGSKSGSDGTIATPADERPSLVPGKEEFVFKWVQCDARQPHDPLVLGDLVSPPYLFSPSAVRHRIAKPKTVLRLYPRWQTDSERGRDLCRRLYKRQRTQ